MVKKVIEASEAVAMGIRLSRPAVIPMYPITPQTHIVERLAEYINDGECDASMIHVESEHSAMSAAVGAQATGVRTFTATASQGLALMNEILFIASGMRLPIVMAVANRALSAPINIWNDHSDSFSARDSGWIQIYAESAQEALDASIQAFMVGEDPAVLLPVMVCIDGFTLSHVYEPVDIPVQHEVDSILPPYKPIHAFLDSARPITQGPIGFPDMYMETKFAQHQAMGAAVQAIQKANWIYSEKFGRGYGDGLVETYRLDDAEYALVALGSVCGTIRVVVDELRKEGKKVGLLKIRSFRPFPGAQIRDKLRTLKGAGIIDKEVSFGQEGTLYSEIRSAMFRDDIIINGFIAGLGGRDITKDHVRDAFSGLGSQAGPKWLF